MMSNQRKNKNHNNNDRRTCKCINEGLSCPMLLHQYTKACDENACTSTKSKHLFSWLFVTFLCILHINNTTHHISWHDRIIKNTCILKVLCDLNMQSHASPGKWMSPRLHKFLNNLFSSFFIQIIINQNSVLGKNTWADLYNRSSITLK